MKSLVSTLLSGILAALLFGTTGFAVAQQVKAGTVAVAANDKTTSASVGNQLGRSPYFLLFDKQGTLIEAVANPYKDGGNSGIPSIDLLAGKGVTVMVAEGFGPRIVEVMKGKGMRPVEFKGNAKDAVKKALDLK
jgi:predicted Fe-Mo cluster-binding NifX family protein